MFDDLKTIIHNTLDSIQDIEQADVIVSDAIKAFCKAHPVLRDYSFFSEEDQTEPFALPMVLLDPIDGTNMYRAGIPEYCVSMSVLASFDLDADRNIHWLYNPVTKEEVIVENQTWIQETPMQRQASDQAYVSHVSRTEFKKYQLAEKAHMPVHWIPTGSIAYKLLLLSQGACDFVISIHNKNIWDIMAGTRVLQQKGYVFVCAGEVQSRLDQVLYEGPMFWCRPDQVAEVQAMVQSVVE